MAGILFLVGAALVPALLPKGPPSGTGGLPVYWELPSFSFTDQMGRTVSSEQLGGKVIVANFIFTDCTVFCPTALTPRMKELQDALRNLGLAGREVVLLSFSVDPEQDTPEKLRSYAESYGADPEVWHFLTGNLQEVQRVVTSGLRLGFQKLPESFEHVHPDGSVHAHEYDVMHSNSFVLVDRRGQVRAIYNAVYDWDQDRVLADIQKLLASPR